MTKESGIGASLAIDDGSGTTRVVTNDIMSVNFDTPRGGLDVTGLDVSSMERLLGLGDFQSTVNGAFNDAATTGWHTVISDALSTDTVREWIYVLSGQTLAVETICTGVSYARGADGSMGINATFALQEGVDPTWS